MRKWLSGIRGMVLLVGLWTAGWGLGFGGLAELFVDPSGEILDLWPMELAIPGFFGGIAFAVLLRVAEGTRRFDQVPPARLTLWGLLAGLALGALSAATGGPIPLSLTTAEMLGLATTLGGVAGAGCFVFFGLVSRPPAVLRRIG